MKVDFRRTGIINQLKMYTNSPTDDRLLDHLQLEMCPTAVSDCAVNLDDVTTEDLRAALAAVRGELAI